MNTIEDLIRTLDAIAEKNDDEFGYSIQIGKKFGMPWFSFVAVETADGHEFLSGSGTTITEAVQNALNSIPAACKSWGYSYGAPV